MHWETYTLTEPRQGYMAALWGAHGPDAAVYAVVTAGSRPVLWFKMAVASAKVAVGMQA